MLELKHKNSLEHSSRLEEREADLKKVIALTVRVNVTLNEFSCPGILQATRPIHRTIQNACGLHGTNQNSDEFNALAN